MRRYLYSSLFLSIILLARSAGASGITPYNDFSKNNVSIEGDIVSNGKKVNGKPGGAQTMKQTEDVSVRIVSVVKGATPNIECYFVYREKTGNPWAEKADPKGDPAADGTLQYEATADITVAAPAKTGQKSASTKPVTEADRESGASIVGWLAFATSNGQVVGVAASNETFMDWAKNPDALDAAVVYGAKVRDSQAKKAAAVKAAATAAAAAAAAAR